MGAPTLCTSLLTMVTLACSFRRRMIVEESLPRLGETVMDAIAAAVMCGSAGNKARGMTKV
jgi:hypothetical protein